MCVSSFYGMTILSSISCASFVKEFFRVHWDSLFRLLFKRKVTVASVYLKLFSVFYLQPNFNGDKDERDNSFFYQCNCLINRKMAKRIAPPNREKIICLFPCIKFLSFFLFFLALYIVHGICCKTGLYRNSRLLKNTTFACTE